MSESTIVVVGGGSAGFTAAGTAADLGARVVLIMGDDHRTASLCVNRGCMPSKAMFQPVDTMHHARRQRWLRVEPREPGDYLAEIVDWKDREIARFRAFRQRAIRRRAGDEFLIVPHDARFTDPHTLEAGGERYEADAVILATGSTPWCPPIPGMDAVRAGIWTNVDILENRELPESLTVIGAGAIGLEFALRYRRLGCRVTIITRSLPLSRFPDRFGRRIVEIYEDEGIRLLCHHEAARIDRDVEGWYVVEAEGPEGVEPVAGERVLVATGRRPALDRLDLPAAGIETDEGGFLDVGEDLRVAGHDHVFVAGDASGRRMVVHQAHIEAGIAAENAVEEGDRRWDRRADLQVVFADPEFAYAGLTPEDAMAAGHGVVSASKESRLVGKLHLAGDDHGFGEFVADVDDHRLLGAGLLCDGASDLIHLPAYVIDHEHTVHEAAAGEYYHPTKTEIVSGILDELCEELGGRPYARADERTG